MDWGMVSAILDLVTRLSDCNDRHAQCLRDLGDKLKNLETAMNELKGLGEDVEQRTREAERRQLQLTNQVKGWLKSFEDREKKFKEVLDRGQEDLQRRCLGGYCSKNCFSSYNLGKDVINELDAVKELTNKGQNLVIARQRPTDPVNEIPLETTFGLDSTFWEVWKCICEENVGIIGIYGMGGVGKTTLLKKINNEFLTITAAATTATATINHECELVIWVSVSREANLDNVQNIIGSKLGISDGIWVTKDKTDKAADIYKALKRKNYVLLLDDLWKRMDLLEVGIPPPSNQTFAKIVFTTRSLDICRDMEARLSFRVECLSPTDALNLFQYKVGENTWNSDPEIPKLAQVIAYECKFLPIALITIARSVKDKKPHEWKQVIQKLQSYPSSFPGLAGDVFRSLKYSYDSLSKDMYRRCFLYWRIFPKNHNIMKNELIDLWIGEGLIESVDRYDARSEGEDIIDNLKAASLLESSESEDSVRMHDVVHEMALWLAHAIEKTNDKILVLGHARLIKLHGLARWKEFKRVSLWGNTFQNLTETPVCPHLVTLLVRNTKLKKLPDAFFQSMPALKVLDLSDNPELTELPVGLGELISLEHLNLSRTELKKLPTEINQLKNLKYLRMNGTKELQSIPEGLISPLSSLQAFSKIPSMGEYYASQSFDEKVLLQELNQLDHLNDLGVTLSTHPSVLYLLSSSKLSRSISYLTLMECSNLSSLNISSLKRIERLDIRACVSLEDLKISPDEEQLQGSMPAYLPSRSMLREERLLHNLSHVQFWGCQIKEVTWLIYAPSLRILEINSCPSIIELINDDMRPAEVEEGLPDLFSNLKELSLMDLENLESIRRRAMSFPSLISIRVFQCPSLLKLPFDSTSDLSNLKEVRGEESWWDLLQWEVEALTLKESLRPKFVK